MSGTPDGIGDAGSGRLDRIQRLLRRSVPLLGVVALATAIAAIAVEGSGMARVGLEEAVPRSILYVIASFVGSYMPVPGQAAEPTVLGSWVLVLALATSLAGVMLAVLAVVARDVATAIILSKRHLHIVIGDSEQAGVFAARLRSDARAVATVGEAESATIRRSNGVDLARLPRVKRAVRRADAVYVMRPSTVDAALDALAIRAMPGGARIFQMFDWEKDRLVFRPAITTGVLPRSETFSPLENTGIHIAHLVSHLVRLTRRSVRVHLDGDHAALGIVRERLEFMRGALAFRGGVEFVATVEAADVVVLGVEQQDYVPAVENAAGPERVVFVVAPERYFTAVGRTDLAVVTSARWLSERDESGHLEWRSRVVVVDEAHVGYEPDEITLGVRGRWAREFHNAHSDFTTGEPPVACPNRWLDRMPHPRLVAMADAAVELMLLDLRRLGYGLVVREGEHDVLVESEIESCAQRIHERYLETTWRDERGTERRAAEYFVEPGGGLRTAAPPPPWEQDSDFARDRNRMMVRAVYPALAAVFGYRITRLSAIEERAS